MMHLTRHQSHVVPRATVFGDRASSANLETQARSTIEDEALVVAANFDALNVLSAIGWVGVVADIQTLNLNALWIVTERMQNHFDLRELQRV